MKGFTAGEDLDLTHVNRQICLRVPNVAAMGNAKSGALHLPAKMVAKRLFKFDAEGGIDQILRAVRGVVVRVAAGIR